MAKRFTGGRLVKKIRWPKSPERSVVYLTGVVIFIVCLFYGLTAWPAVDNLVVGTTIGELRGIERRSGGAEFLGIPYAQPPVGDLRWRDPLPVKPWSGVRDAAAFGAPCAQPDLGDWNRHDSERGMEDCLFLNVITPVWPPKARMPVMFWIHGGGNMGGTASSALYKDGSLVQHGVILVTVNYRLGTFGFLAHPGLTAESGHHASGNYGLLDQIAALEWVRENIAKFGGDPKNITVFGQSAGAQDTSLLMTSPLSKNMFQRAIVESGASFMVHLPSLAEAEQTGQKLAATLKAPAGADAIKYLRQLPPEDLVRAAVPQDPKQPAIFGPDIDGWAIVQSPAAIFASGQEAVVPLIIGTTTREFDLTASPDKLRKIIQNATGSFADRTLAMYGLADNGQGSADPTYGSVADQWYSDSLFRCPVATQAIWHGKAHHSVYQYEFQHAVPGHEQEGAVHSADLPYVFGYYPKTGNIAGPFNETDFKLADLMQTYWTNFAKTGNPNSRTAPNWPELDNSQTLIQFTQDGRVVAKAGGLRRPQCDLYREWLTGQINQRK